MTEPGPHAGQRLEDHRRECQRVPQREAPADPRIEGHVGSVSSSVQRTESTSMAASIPSNFRGGVRAIPFPAGLQTSGRRKGFPNEKTPENLAIHQGFLVDLRGLEPLTP